MADGQMFKSIYGQPETPDQPSLSPTFNQTMRSAFGLENDVVNFFDWLTRERTPADPHFDYRKAMVEGGVPEEWRVNLAATTSQQDFDATLQRIQSEEQNKAVLAASGLTGTVAAIGAGILSPTVYIPFVGQGRRGMAFAEILGLAAAGATAQEAVLYMNQETRTEAEVFQGIALQTLFAGMLGVGWARLAPEGKARMLRDFPDSQRKALVPSENLDMGYTPRTNVRVEAPPREEAATLLRQPDLEGRDAGASRAAKVEGDAPGVFRVYRLGDGTEGEGGIRFTTSREAAAQASERLYYLDLAPDDPRVKLVEEARQVDPEGIRGVPLTLMEAEQRKLVEVYKGPDPNDPVIKERLEAAEDLEVGMGHPAAQEAIPSTRAIDADPAGAQVSGRVRNVEGPKAAPSRWRQAAMDTLGKVNPWYRMAQSRQHPSLRDAAYRLADTGIVQEGLGRSEPSAIGGTVYDRFGLMDQHVARYLTAWDDAYYRHVFGVPPAEGVDIGTIVGKLKNSVGWVPAGKMNPKEFHAAVYDSLSQGEILHPDVKPAVDALRNFFGFYNQLHKDYLKELEALDPNVKPLYKELMEDQMGVGVKEYAHQIYSAELIMENADEFLSDFTDFYRGTLESDFTKDFKRFSKRRAELEMLNRFKAMTPVERDAWFTGVRDEIDGYNELPEMEERLARRADLRAQAKEEGWKAGELRAALKELDEDLTPATKALLDGQNAAKKMLRELKKLGADELAEARKARETLEKEEAKLESMFRHQIPALERLDLSIGREMKEKEKAFTAATKLVKKTLGELQKREAKLAELAESRRSNPKTQAKVLEQIKSRKLQYEAALERLETVEGKSVDIDLRLHELHTARELAVKDATRLAAMRGHKMVEAQEFIADATPNTTRIETGVEVTVPGPDGPRTFSNPLVVADYDALRKRLYPSVERSQEEWDNHIAVVSNESLLNDAVNHGYDGVYLSKGDGAPPEWVDRREDARDMSVEKLDQSFRAKWSGRGERSGDSTLGKPDFEEEALNAATYWMQKLTKSSAEPAYFLAKQDRRGPQLMRMMNVPYDIKKKYLNRDTEVVARAFDRTMAPDLELWRAFDGHVNGSNVLAEMGQEAADLTMAMHKAKYVKLPKGWVDKTKPIIERIGKRLYDAGNTDDLYVDPKNFSDVAKEGYVELTPSLRTHITNAIEAELAQQTRNFTIAIERLRNTRMVPRDGQAIMYRGGRMLKDLNVTLMMGGVMLQSIPDLARPLYAHGVAKVAKHGWGSYVQNLTSASGKKFRAASKEVNQQLGLTLEPLLHGRANAIGDMVSPHEAAGHTRLEKGVRFLAHKTGIVALFSQWTAMNKAVAGAVTQATLLTYIPRVAEVLRRNGTFGDETQGMLEYLRQRGLRDMDIMRIAAQIERPGMMEEFSNGAKLPNLGDWDDMAAYRAYGAAVRNEVNKLIITPGLEQPNWTDENLAYSMMAQFKSFTFASTSRIAMSNLQGSDPYLVQATLATLATGALAYYTWAVASGGKALERAHQGDVADWIYESVDRSGILGVLSWPQQVGEQIPMLAQYDVFGGADKAYRRPVGLAGTVFGPSAGQFEKMTEFVKNLGAEEASLQRRNLKLLRQMFIPYQNLFYTKQALDKVGDQINQALGIAE